MQLIPSNPFEAKYSDSPSHCEQTIDYIVEFKFESRIEYRRYHSLDNALRDRAIEKRRRSKADRLIAARINNQLTKHGRDFYEQEHGSRFAHDLAPILGISLDEWKTL